MSSFVYFDEVVRESLNAANKKMAVPSQQLDGSDCSKQPLGKLPENAKMICANASIDWRRKKSDGKWAKKAQEFGLTFESCKALLRK